MYTKNYGQKGVTEVTTRNAQQYFMWEPSNYRLDSSEFTSNYNLGQ